MRKITAHYIFPVNAPALKNGIIVLDDQHIITDIIEQNGPIKEIAKLEFYNGVLIPGLLSKDIAGPDPDLFSHFKQEYFKHLETFDHLLLKFTLGAASKNNLSSKFGSIEPGKSPGIFLISPFDYQQMSLTPQSKVKVIA